MPDNKFYIPIGFEVELKKLILEKYGSIKLFYKDCDRYYYIINTLYIKKFIDKRYNDENLGGNLKHFPPADKENETQRKKVNNKSVVFDKYKVLARFLNYRHNFNHSIYYPYQYYNDLMDNTICYEHNNSIICHYDHSNYKNFERSNLGKYNYYEIIEQYNSKIGIFSYSFYEAKTVNTTYQQYIHYVQQNNFLGNNVADNCKVKYEIKKVKYKDLDPDQRMEVKKNWVPLHSENLKSILGRHNYLKILNDLRQWGIIEGIDSYQPNIVCKKYRLNPEFHKRKFKSIPVLNSKLISKIDYVKAKHKEEYAEHVQQIYKMLYGFSVDYYAANQYLNSVFIISHFNDKNIIEKIKSVNMNLEFICSNRLYFTQDKNTGRIFHPFANLQKEFRQFIITKDNEKCAVELDIACSQPFFLSLAYNGNENYNKIAVNGDLYDHIVRKYYKRNKNYDKTRKSVKNAVLALFFDIQRGWKSNTKKCFTSEFGDVYEFICREKKEDYKNMSKLLQKMEADMMINDISIELLKIGIDFVPVHDSFIVTEANASEVKKIMETRFRNKFGVIPTIRKK